MLFNDSVSISEFMTDRRKDTKTKISRPNWEVWDLKLAVVKMSIVK
jgi:hypothetical protein